MALPCAILVEGFFASMVQASYPDSLTVSFHEAASTMDEVGVFFIAI